MKILVCPLCEAGLRIPDELPLRIVALPVHLSGHAGEPMDLAESLREFGVCNASEQLAEIVEREGEI